MLVNAACFIALVFGGLSLAAVPFGVRALLKDYSTPPQQPDVSPDPRPGGVRCRRTVMFGDLAPNITGGPLQEAS